MNFVLSRFARSIYTVCVQIRIWNSSAHKLAGRTFDLYLANLINYNYVSTNKTFPGFQYSRFPHMHYVNFIILCKDGIGISHCEFQSLSQFYDLPPIWARCNGFYDTTKAVKGQKEKQKCTGIQYLKPFKCHLSSCTYSTP